MKMTAQQYLEQLTKLVAENPDAILIYASDDEGNNFRETHFSPTLGNFSLTDYSNGEFIPQDSEDFESHELNAICLN